MAQAVAVSLAMDLDLLSSKPGKGICKKKKDIFRLSIINKSRAVVRNNGNEFAVKSVQISYL